MTRVRFERRMASPTHSARPGDILDLPAAEAAQRVESGQCTYVDAPAALGDSGEDPATAPPGDAPAVDLHEMTVAQLKEYATGHEIDLDGVSKKAEILDRITTVLAQREAEAEENDGDDPTTESGGPDGGEGG